ncbi:hypothetical protein UCREL1_8992 [Eutypa lata UCREL1]|uniref:Secreted protein n=1 Tax=Eutypa lata (strain UCR-EL1) TaxID=1287681 RepID=M7T2H7_EUTLA|nr:hypothetical protein UCREL1_8992 [Eutypa lata UCREL1]
MLFLISFLLLAVHVLAADIVPAPIEGLPGVFLRSEELPEGYTEGPIMWSGFHDYFDSAPGVNASTKSALKGLQLNGTVQEVYHELAGRGLFLYPTNTSDLPAKVAAIQNKNLDDDFSPPTRNQIKTCGVGGVGRMFAFDLWDGATYLAGLPDEARCANTGRTCGRISCSCFFSSYVLTIVLTDNNYVLEYPCNLFASYAWEIYDGCSYAGGDNRQCQGTMREVIINFRTVVGLSAEKC